MSHISLPRTGMPRRRPACVRSWSLRRIGRLGRPLRIEPLEWRTLLAADWGDAPEFYPTLLSEDGARHEAVGPMLGATRDAEADGVLSPAADADCADEDGVRFGTIQAGALGDTVTVDVTGGQQETRMNPSGS